MSALGDTALSAGVALLLAGAGVVLGISPHRTHDRVGATEQRHLVSVIEGSGVAAVVMGTAQHRIAGYADRDETCAAVASVDIRTDRLSYVITALLGQEHLPNLEVSSLAPGLQRVSVRKTFGLNPFDWSCWQ